MIHPLIIPKPHAIIFHRCIATTVIAGRVYDLSASITTYIELRLIKEINACTPARDSFRHILFLFFELFLDKNKNPLKQYKNLTVNPKYVIFYFFALNIFLVTSAINLENLDAL